VSFVTRRIDVTIALGEGNFGNTGANTVKLQNLRVSCQIQRSGLPGADTANVKIYGISLSLMNQLSQLGAVTTYLRNNRILIEAGDADAGMSTAFNGTIDWSAASIDEQPYAFLEVAAFTGILPALKPAAATSFQGSADAADVIQGIAKRMGYGFENNGVSVQLGTPYFSGSARQQLLTCINAANIYGYIDDVKKVIAIWPIGGSRAGSIPLVSVESGMVGYPRFSDFNIALRTRYNPSLTMGGDFTVKSTLTGANKKWTVNQLGHNLESQIPGGAWFSDFQGYIFGESRVTAT